MKMEILKMIKVMMAMVMMVKLATSEGFDVWIIVSRSFVSLEEIFPGDGQWLPQCQKHLDCHDIILCKMALTKQCNNVSARVDMGVLCQDSSLCSNLSVDCNNKKTENWIYSKEIGPSMQLFCHWHVLTQVILSPSKLVSLARNLEKICKSLWLHEH